MDHTADTPPEDPGATLMLAWQAGDEGAFDRLVEAYSDRVWALVTRFLGPVAGREDLVQDVFLRIVRARDRYQPTARFTTWLYRIVFNLAANARERDRHRRHLSLDAPTAGADEGAPTVGDACEDLRLDGPDVELYRSDLVAAVRAAIDALPERQRMALVLARYEELPYAEIAEVLDSSEKAIKSMIHRARETLRATLSPLLLEEA